MSEKNKWVKAGFTELRNPHRANARTYVYPAFGPGNYLSVGSLILASNFAVPTGDDTAELINDTYANSETQGIFHYNGNDNSVRSITRARWLWVFQKNLWTYQGMFSLKDRNARGRSLPLDVAILEKMLKGGTEIKGSGVRISSDGELRFAPKESYSLGEHTPDSLAKDGAMIAQYGQQGAEMLAEASSRLSKGPIIHGLTINDDQPVLRVSTLNGYGRRLRFNGCDSDGSNGCLAFGVRASSK